MSVEITEEFSGFSYDEERQSAVRTFMCVGSSDISDYLSDSRLPRRGASYILYSDTMKCEGTAVQTRLGPTAFRFASRYSVPKDGEYATTPTNPLNAPPVISWTTVEVTEPTDIALNSSNVPNVPILNTAAKPIQGATRSVTYDRLTITRTERSYDLAFARTYRNSVNQAAVVLGNGISANAQHMKCISIAPAESYKASAPYVPMQYVFDIVEAGILGLYPFQSRFLNMSDTGWYSDSGTKREGPFSSGVGVQQKDVRLGLAGTPLAANFSGTKILSGKATDETPVGPPVVPTGFFDNLVTAEAVWLFYRTTRVTDFSALINKLNTTPT